MSTTRKSSSKISTFTLKNWALIFLCLIFCFAIIWLVANVARASRITAMRVELMTQKGDTIASYFGDVDYEEKVIKMSAEMGVQIIIFSYENDRIDLTKYIINTSPYSPGQANVDMTVDEFYQDMVNTCVLNMINTGEISSCDVYETGYFNTSFIVYYRLLYLGESKFFLYVSQPLSITADAEQILNEQLLTATFVSFVVVLIMSIFIAIKISGPIKDLSENADRMTKGDYSVFFDGDGTQEIDKLAEGLNYALSQMQQTQALRQDVIANVSHDLKTPLTLIKSYAELLKDFPDAPPKKREERLNLIISETDRMTRLVNEMLRLAKEESGVVPINKTIFSLSELVNDVVAVFSVKENEGYKFEINVQPDLYVSADRSQIEKVLHNYIQNAVSYTGKDLKVKIELKEINGKARFDVIDTGKGIAKEEQEKIWDRYYRASKQYTRGSGTGLGLSIVKNILTRHGLNYGVNSVVGKGSDFYFEIELVNPPQIEN